MIKSQPQPLNKVNKYFIHTAEYPDNAQSPCSQPLLQREIVSSASATGTIVKHSDSQPASQEECYEDSERSLLRIPQSWRIFQ